MRRFVSLLLLLALLTACGGPADPEAEIPTLAPGPTTPSEDGPVTISFATAEYERTAYEALAQKFTAENPNIKVTIVPIEDLSNVQSPDGQYNPLDIVRSVVSGADTAPANYIYLPPEALASGLLLDLKPLMDADSAFQREDFYPGALEQQTINDKIVLLPRYLNAQILTYNKELFKQANLPAPKPEWTWTDLLGAAEQLGKRDGGLGDTYGFFDTSGGFMALAAMLQVDGIDLFNTPSRDVQLDRPEIIAAIKRLRELTKSGAIYTPSFGRPEGPSESPEDPQQIVRDGRVGIWGSDFMGMAYSSDGPQQQPEPLSFETGQVPYPSGNELLRGGGGFGGEGYFISSGTQYPNQAWKWIEFLSRQPIESNDGGIGPKPVGGAPGRIPARVSLAEQTGFWKEIDEETAAAYKWTIAHPAKPLERQPDYLAIGSLSQALYQILPDDKADIAKILGDAQTELEKQVADMQLTPTPTIDTSPVLVATPEPQTAPEGATTVIFEVNGYNPADIRRIARSFREQHPEIFVQIKSTQIYTEPVSIARIAQTSDCFTWYSAPQTEEDFKAMLDLQPLFDSDASFPRDDYPAALLTAYQNGGGLFGLPYSVNLRTLNYNRTAFDAAGAQAPTASWKPSDFLAAAQALTKGEGDKQQFGYVALNGVLSDMLFFAGQFNARLTLGSGVDVRPNFGDPKVVEAVQWYIDLAKVHKVMPELKISYRRDDPGFEDKSWEYAQSGRAGMWFAQGPMFNYGDEAGSTFKRMPGGQDGPTFEEGISALPLGGAGLSSSDFYARGFHISASSQQAQACWEWIKFLSADTNPNTLQGGIPARTSIAQSEAFTKQAPASQVAIYKAYAEALKREGRPGDNPDALYGQMDLYWFYKALDETLTKDADLAQGLADAQTTTTAYMDCLEQNGKPLKLATCANQVDPTYQGYNTEDMTDEPPVIGIPRG